MGQFTEIKRRLTAGLTETITVSGSFLYITKLDRRVRIELYNRENAEKSEVILEEGMTWAEDPNILNRFTALNIVSEIDQDVVLLAGFGRITNEMMTIKTSKESPLQVDIINEIPLNVFDNGYYTKGLKQLTALVMATSYNIIAERSMTNDIDYIFDCPYGFGISVGFQHYTDNIIHYPPNYKGAVTVPKADQLFFSLMHRYAPNVTVSTLKFYRVIK